MNKKSIAFLCAIFCAWAINSFAGTGTIGHIFERRSPVKAHVGTVTNESGNDKVSIDLFKSALENSLNKRKVLDFDTVDGPTESDIQISAIIKKYIYMDKGPFKPMPGMMPITLADAAATVTSNYVEMEVLYTVTETKSNNILWTDLVKEYVKKVMTPEESAPIIYDKVTRKFLSQCFGHSHNTATVKTPM